MVEPSFNKDVTFELLDETSSVKSEQSDSDEEINYKLLNVPLKPAAPKMKEKKFQCEICLKSFRKPCEVRKHNEVVHEKLRPFKCEFCYKVFGRLNHLKRHLLIVHSK